MHNYSDADICIGRLSIARLAFVKTKSVFSLLVTIYIFKMEIHFLLHQPQLPSFYLFEAARLRGRPC